MQIQPLFVIKSKAGREGWINRSLPQSIPSEDIKNPPSPEVLGSSSMGKDTLSAHIFSSPTIFE